MPFLLSTPLRATSFGLIIAALVLVIWIASTGADGEALATMALRVAHVLAALVWGGFIVFVNLVQLVALAKADETERGGIVRQIVPRTARVFTDAAHVTLLTGGLLLMTLAPSIVYRPLLLAAIVGGVAMWAIVVFALRPNIARVTGSVPATPEEKAKARATVELFARVNLVLLLPVTVAMVVAVHGGL